VLRAGTGSTRSCSTRAQATGDRGALGRVLRRELGLPTPSVPPDLEPAQRPDPEAMRQGSTRQSGPESAPPASSTETRKLSDARRGREARRSQAGVPGGSRRGRGWARGEPRHAGRKTQDRRFRGRRIFRLAAAGRTSGRRRSSKPLKGVPGGGSRCRQSVMATPSKALRADFRGASARRSSRQDRPKNGRDTSVRGTIHRVAKT